MVSERDSKGELNRWYANNFYEDSRQFLTMDSVECKWHIVCWLWQVRGFAPIGMAEYWYVGHEVKLSAIMGPGILQYWVNGQIVLTIKYKMDYILWKRTIPLFHVWGKNAYLKKQPVFYCPARGMGEKPSPLGEDFSLIVDASSRVQGVQGPGIQGDVWMVFSLGPSNPWILEPREPSALAEGSWLLDLKAKSRLHRRNLNPWPAMSIL